MTASAISLLTYVWHYLFARMLYDQLLRPLSHGRVPSALLIVSAAVAAFAIGRWSRR
jgi:hypothetical protein